MASKSTDRKKKVDGYVFQQSDLLASGRNSAVYKGVQEANGTQVAIKIVNISQMKSKVAARLLDCQEQILRKLDHANVIHCHNVIRTVHNCYIITDYYEKGDLEGSILTLNKTASHEVDRERLTADIYKGLSYLADNHIIHRDLKPANVLLTKEGRAVIADFGFSIVSKMLFKDVAIGSPLYMSPQGLISNIYGPKTDVWSFGALVYELYHGQAPYSQFKNAEQLKGAFKSKLRFAPHVPCDVVNFIQKCMTYAESTRPTIGDLAQDLYIKRILKTQDNSIEEESVDESLSMCEAKDDESTLPSMTDKDEGENLRIFPSRLLAVQILASLVNYCKLIDSVNGVIKNDTLSQWCHQMAAFVSSQATNHPNAIQLQYSLTEIAPSIQLRPPCEQNINVDDVIRILDKYEQLVSAGRHSPPNRGSPIGSPGRQSPLNQSKAHHSPQGSNQPLYPTNQSINQTNQSIHNLNQSVHQSNAASQVQNGFCATNTIVFVAYNSIKQAVKESLLQTSLIKTCIQFRRFDLFMVKAGRRQ